MRSTEHIMKALRTTRLFASFVAAAVLGLLPLASQAQAHCTPAEANGAQRCRAHLPAAVMQSIQKTQEKSQWCWAAAIAMILSRHGVTVSQEEVVRRQFGDALDMAASGEAITRLLSSSWRGAGGQEVYARTAVGDREAKRAQLTNARLVEELAQQRPLLFGTEGHAMVLVGVEYERTAQGAVRITGGMVIDPAPGQGLRRLGRDEMRPAYVAAVQMQGGEQLAAAAPASESGGQ
jgi:ABC-type bacteriocin/lantibiotic exporter with double-glycine peptidase domain